MQHTAGKRSGGVRLWDIGPDLRAYVCHPRQPECQRLARARGGDADEVPPRQDDRPALRLDGGGLGEAPRAGHQVAGKPGLGELHHGG
eukprot:scaffold35825_cov22-Prasinocladus_malaysianus.AAC.1